MSRQITEKEKESLLSLKPDDLTFSCLVGLFGDTTTLHTKSLSNISKSKLASPNNGMALYSRFPKKLAVIFLFFILKSACDKIFMFVNGFNKS